MLVDERTNEQTNGSGEDGLHDSVHVANNNKNGKLISMELDWMNEWVTQFIYSNQIG